MEAVRQGAQVYHHRHRWLVVVYALMSLFSLYQAPSVVLGAVSLAIMWVVVDVYGAVLHVVLDEPAFINAPIIKDLIGPAALEFQWHHTIPRDIVSKSFLEVCGDLNLTVALHLVWHVMIWGFNSPLANAMAGAKIMMAYLGQWAHRMAHTPDSARPAWATTAQSLGLLVTPALHRVHHSGNHDEAFPILSGFTSPFVAWLLKVMPDRRMWLLLFGVMSFGDIYVCTRLLSAVTGA